MYGGSPSLLMARDVVRVVVYVWRRAWITFCGRGSLSILRGVVYVLWEGGLHNVRGVAYVL